jgi:hypothetical protein
VAQSNTHAPVKSLPVAWRLLLLGVVGIRELLFRYFLVLVFPMRARLYSAAGLHAGAWLGTFPVTCMTSA